MPNKISNRPGAAVGWIGRSVGDGMGRLVGATRGGPAVGGFTGGGHVVAVFTTHWQVVASHVASWHGLVVVRVQSSSMVQAGFRHRERYKSHWFCMRARCWFVNVFMQASSE